MARKLHRVIGLLFVGLLLASVMATASTARAATTMSLGPIEVEGDSLCVWSKSEIIDVCVDLAGKATVELTLHTSDPHARFHLGPYCDDVCRLGYAAPIELKGDAVLDLLVYYQHCCGEEPIEVVHEHIHLDSLDSYEDGVLYSDTLYLCILKAK